MSTEFQSHWNAGTQKIGGNMSAKVWTFLVAVTIAMTLAVFPALAQSTALRANIPFPFMVNEVEFTPGIYTAQLTSSRQVLEIRSEDGKKAAFVLLLAAHSNRAQHHGLFVFSGYGSQYFLSKVSWP